MSLRESLKSKRSELQRAVHKAKELHADLAEREENGEDVDATERQKLSNLIDQGSELRGEVNELKELVENDEFVNTTSEDPANAGQPDNRRSNGNQSWGTKVIGSEQFANARRKEMDPVEVGSFLKRLAVKKLYGSTDARGGHLVDEDELPGVLDIVRQRPESVINLVTRRRTDSDAIEYFELSARSNAAAPTAEFDASPDFGQAPESDLTFNKRTANVKRIPTWIAASMQVLDDAPQLRDIIDGELEYMIEKELEDQVIAGDGTGENMTGLTNWSGVQTRTHGSAPSGRNQTASDNKADTIRRALTDIQLEFYEANGVVLHPSDAEELELEQDGNGNYLNVYDPVRQRIWRKPVVVTPAVASNTGIVANFRMGAVLWDRQATEIRVGQPNAYFLKSAVAVLAELRAAFAVVRPLAVEIITFDS